MIEKDNYLQFKTLLEFNNIGHFYSKKPLDFNYNLNSTNEINNNFNFMKKITNYDFKYIKGCNQTHSNNVKIVDSNNLYEEFDDCDGLITNLKNIALITKTADCQSILLYDPINSVIGNIHSGWKGTLNTIIINAIDIMEKEFHSNKSSILVFICPSIHKCCFEVEEDVMNLFKNKFNTIKDFIIGDKKGKYYIDTIKLNKTLLINYGLNEKNIFDSNLCTKCMRDKFHSYRVEKDKSGRNIALIYLKN